MKKIKALIKKRKEVILYLVFGVCTTAVNWVIYALMVTLFDCNITLGNAIAWLVAVFFAFFTNKLFVFESKSWKFRIIVREMLTFFGGRIVTGIIEIFAPTALYALGLDQSIFGIKGFAAKIVVSVVVIVLNYIISKWIVFRRREEPKRNS